MKRAFTLVELLVVITIMVLLLALLMPALDQAIYQAELTVDGANQAGTATALITYAANHKRFFPHRPNVGAAAMNIWQLSGAGVAINWTMNLKGYLDVNRSFNDPLCKSIEVEKASTVSGVFTPYSYYAGGRFSQKGAAFQKGMLKLGDRLEWHLDETDTAYPSGPKSYDLLIGDFAYTAIAGNAGIGSHPDKSGVWTPYWIQEGGNRYNATAAAGVYQNMLTATWWEGGMRGLIDLNFTRSDGSVQRLVDVRFTQDDRMELIPAHWDNQYRWRVQAPPR